MHRGSVLALRPLNAERGVSSVRSFKQRIRMSPTIVTCVAFGIVVSCGGEHSISTGLRAEASSQAANASEAPGQPLPVEDVYVARSRFSSPNLPVTSFCDAAHSPADYPVERERHYEYWSTIGRPTD